MLFAYLVLEQGRPVPRDELAEALWADTPPATWEKALTVLASKLRTLLASTGADPAVALTSAFGCYRLELPQGSWVDVLAAEQAVARAERASAAGDAQRARSAAAEAELLTRSVFLPGDSGTWVEDKRRDLTDVRARALDTLGESCLDAGALRDAVSWAEQAIQLEPFREAGYRLLMRAHAAGGNRGEALRVYERCRRLLDDELGAYPSPETEAIYIQLLHDPRSSPSRPSPAPSAPPFEPSRVPPTSRMPYATPALRSPRRRRRRMLFLAALIAAGAGLVTGVVESSGGRSSGVRVSPNSVVALTDAGSVSSSVPVGTRPVALASAGGSLWVANLDDQSVTRVDVTAHRVVRSVPTSGLPTAVAATGTTVWVSDNSGDIVRIDPDYNQATPFRQLGSDLTTGRDEAWPMVAAFGSLWVANPNGYVVRLDEGTGRETGSVDTGNEPSAVAVGAGSVWVSNGADGTVTRIDPSTLVAATIPVGHGPDAVAVDTDGVWVADAGSDEVVRIDPETNTVDRTTVVGSAPTAMLARPGAIWAANAGDGTVMRIDARSGRVVKTIHLTGSPTALSAAGDRVWVALSPAIPAPPRSGGVLRVNTDEELPPPDPALLAEYEPRITYATCANLLGYADVAGPEGSQIVPEVAQAVPTPLDGGRTYVFTIRPGFRFSPPSNQPVTAATFKATIERVVNPRLGSPFATVFADIAGFEAFQAGHAAGLRGLTARGNTLRIRLTRPDGALLARLANGSACAVPTGTPAVSGGLADVPMAGPYYFASYTPRHQLVLRRNPNYHGNRPRRPVEIVVTMGADPARTLAGIEAGHVDYALSGLPRDAAGELDAKYGPGSPAARAGHQQYFITPANGMRWLHMNTSRPLFADARLRRAVNYAIDRRALVEQSARFTEDNPFNAGTPTDDYMPPAVIGAPDYQLYPLDGPDLATARRLAGHVHATAIMYTPSSAPWLQEAQIVRTDLAPLGIDVEIKQFPIGTFFGRLAHRGEPFDLAVSGWGNGSSDPADVLDTFDGSTIGPDDNANFSYLDDPAFDRMLHTADVMTGSRRYRAFAQLELHLERDIAPVAAFATNANRDFFSARIGCQLDQAVFGMDLGALCVRAPHR